MTAWSKTSGQQQNLTCTELREAPGAYRTLKLPPIVPWLAAAAPMALGAGQAVKHGGEDGQISKDRNNDHGHAQWMKSLKFAKTDFTSL